MAQETNGSGILIVLLSVITQIIFILLKMTGLLIWSWWVIFSPLFVLIGLLILTLLAIPILGIFSKLK